MIFNRTGRVRDDFYVLGHPWSPVYLLDGWRPVLFEAGFCCLGRIYEEAIRAVLGRCRPEILFITHVHYDHCGATFYLKKVFPGLQVAASSIAAQIIERPNAQKLMRTLSQNVISLVTGVDRTKLLNEPFEPFKVDMILSDGQVVELEEGLTVQVLATPGHTRDLLSYYIPEKKILIATEAAGCADLTGHIVTEFLVDYETYLAGLKRLAALEVEVLCQGHHFVFVGAAVKDFFARSIESTERFRARVEELLRAERGSVERVVARIKAEEHDDKPLPKQPEKAYLLNLRARVNHLAERLRDI
ncbi:MAG: MBL fold metallo-hydrolase [Deltaproteobacteria bacterium]|nr:MBL fold metallo-hydrolase [Deltaproteobacteria bacterium]